MNSPFTGTHAAFEVFYDETVSITTKDGKRDTFPVAVFTDGYSDPLDDSMMETDRTDVRFIFKRRDWSFIQKVERGAEIIRFTENRKKYVVSEVKYDSALGWIITARES